MPTLYKIVVTCFVVSIAFGCADREVSKVDPAAAAVGKSEVAVEPNRDLDILFVIDNSISMAQEQQSLATNFPKFIKKLEEIEGGLPNVHIGVISTDVGVGVVNNITESCEEIGGDRGSLQYIARPEPAECNTIPAPPVECTGLEDVFANTGQAFIRDVLNEDGLSRSRNYSSNPSIDPDPELADRFSCIARLGRCGCGFEQPLEAMRMALDPASPNPINAGFLRPNAFLAVIIISDEDDCSMSDTSMLDSEPTEEPGSIKGSYLCFKHGVVCDPDAPNQSGDKLNCRPRPGSETNASDKSQYMKGVEGYADFLKSLKPHDPGLVIVAEITGGIDPVVASIDPVRNILGLEKQCSLGSGENDPKADPAIRLHGFADQFPGRNTKATICQNDLSGALEQVGELLREIVGNRCVDGNIDLDPDKEGIQHECAVADVLNSGTDQEVATSLSQCSSATPAASELPCWRFEEDLDKCGDTVTKLRLLDERGDTPAPVGTRLRLECVIRQ